MAVFPQIYPARKRRPPAGAFIPPNNMSQQRLLQSLLILCQEISSLPSKYYNNGLFKANSNSIVRKTNILSILFQQLLLLLLTKREGPTLYSTSALLCFEEMYVVLQRIKALLEDISSGSKTCLLFHNHSISDSFRELTSELSTLLDIFPAHEFHQHLSPDVLELLRLVSTQCARPSYSTATPEEALRLEVSTLLDRIEKGIVPEYSVLKGIFDRSGLRDADSCEEEMEALQEEEALLHNSSSSSNNNYYNYNNYNDVVSLSSLVRYAKCVLFGASTSNPSKKQKPMGASSGVSEEEANIPSDFRCPISLELMRDPVVVATGQTYDRESIGPWIESGHNTCPKTGQTLANKDLIPNLALKNLISTWCRHHKIPLEMENNYYDTFNCNKVAVEATKMTVSFLVKELSIMESAPWVVYELRTLAKTNSHSRRCMGEIGAIPLLVRYFGSEMPSLQVDAVTTLLNLSILDINKTRIMEADGALNAIVEVLRFGATWEAKGNAAAAIFSLSGIPSYGKRLGRKTRVAKGLLDLARSGPTYAKKDALMAILNLAGDREAVGRLLEGGVIDVVNGLTTSVLSEEAVTVMEAVVKRGGLVGIAAAFNSISKLGDLLRVGSNTTRESAAATLVTICRKGGREMVEEMARISEIERSIWEMMGSGTMRGRRKAAALSRILRRWAAGLDCEYIPAAATTINTTLPSLGGDGIGTSSSSTMLAS